MRIAFGQNGRYGKWLRSLDTVIRIDGTVFVHGGISPAVAALSCDAINETVRRELTSDLALIVKASLSRSDAYSHVVGSLSATSSEWRGAGTKTALLAAVLAHLYRESPEEGTVTELVPGGLGDGFRLEHGDRDRIRRRPRRDRKIGGENESGRE